MTDIIQFITPPPLRGSTLVPDEIVIPTALRDTLHALIAPTAGALTKAGILPFINQIIETLEQVPLLMDEVSVVVVVVVVLVLSTWCCLGNGEIVCIHVS